MRHLYYFVAAAESRSFVRAAKLVNVSQPAITKSIQRMEEWFGHALFERGAQLKLTSFGELVIEDAKRMLGDFDDFRQAAGRFNQIGTTVLKIGAGPLVAETMVGKAVGALLAQHPGVRVIVQVDQHNTFPEMLRDRRIDFFIADISELKEAGDLMIRKLKPSRFQWFCRMGHPLAKGKAVAFHDLRAYPIVLPELPVWAHEWFTKQIPRSAVADASMPLFQPSVVCSHFSTLKKIVLESDAICALTEQALNRKTSGKEFSIIKFKGVMPMSNPGIVSMKRRSLSPAALRLIECLITVCEED